MKKKNVFICDDDQGIVDMLELAIAEFCDVDVHTETQSLFAFDRIITERPDILIVDLSMPFLTGDQLIVKLRESEMLPDLFIICISANKDGLQTSMSAGANVFLSKPFDLDEMIKLVA